jgi:hypothetical protein
VLCADELMRVLAVVEVIERDDVRHGRDGIPARCVTGVAA